MTDLKRLTLALFTGLTLLIFSFSWTDRVVFTDEILFEEAAYQMLKTKDYITPQQEGRVWLEKPPFYFWATALIYEFAPPTPFTRRLPSLIAAVGTLALTYSLALNFFTKKVANWSMLILATSPLFFFFTKTANLDIPNAFFVSATLLAYLVAKTNPRWLLLAGATFALALLTRSFLALTPILIIFLDQMLEKRKIPALYFILTLTLTLTLVLPWHLAVWTKHPVEFTRDYLGFNIQKHLFLQTPGHESVSALSFLFNVLVKVNPLAVFALGNLLPKKKADKEIPRFLLIWIIATLAPLTLAVTRHEWYAIQALPPLAILASQGLVHLERELKYRLLPPTWELVKIFVLALLLALPITVFLNLPKETKSVVTLKQFIAQTPEGTPLFNLEHQYTPQSTLYNPRETPVLVPQQLESLKEPIYLYVDNPAQHQLVADKTNKCCTYEIAVEERDAKILHLMPKQ